MIYDAKTFDEYIAQLPDDRKNPMLNLRNTVKKNLPEGFAENFSKGFMHFVVPLEKYPSGYHASPGEPLPFISIASQKNFIAFYHMGLYAFDDVRDWFFNEYPKHVPTNLDMGKSCVRFKNMDYIPYGLIGELCRKISVDMWIDKYENLKNAGK